ncbi:MAG: 6-hydroxymethylpterin diphosphokinase MptE-like protein [Candidatus Caldarchaeum sp.]
MKTTEWLKHYHEICRKLGIDEERDRLAAETLSKLLSGHGASRQELSSILHSKMFAAVFGAGPSLETDLQQYLHVFEPEAAAIIAVDGATRFFLARGIVPDIVVTDLDGGDDILLRAAEKGCLMVVHAHGDNMEKVEKLVPLMRGRVLGTTQTEPVTGLENFGGFTDGDRAVYMCEELGVEKIVVAGMDFDGEIGAYSKPRPLTVEEQRRKKLKLEIGKTLLETLAAQSSATLLDTSNTSSQIKGFRKITWRELAQMLE